MGHVIRMEWKSIPKRELQYWTPESSRQCEQPKTTWRGMMETVLNTLNYTLRERHVTDRSAG